MKGTSCSCFMKACNRLLREKKLQGFILWKFFSSAKICARGAMRCWTKCRKEPEGEPCPSPQLAVAGTPCAVPTGSKFWEANFGKQALRAASSRTIPILCRHLVTFSHRDILTWHQDVSAHARGCRLQTPGGVTQVQGSTAGELRTVCPCPLV